MGPVKKKIENMYKPKEKNVERLNRFVEKLKNEGELRDHDA